MRSPELSLAQTTFLHELQELAARRQDLVRGARVAVKLNARGELVYAVIVPVKVPPVGWA